MGPLRRISSLLITLALLGGVASSAQQAVEGPSELEERVARLEAALETEREKGSIERGRKLFARSCAACHGTDGAGDGPAAADLNPPPRNFRQGQYRFRTTASGEPPTAADLARTIRRGLPGSAMPAFGDLFSDREIGALVAHLLSLAPASDIADSGEALEVPHPGPVGPNTLRDGRAMYLLLGCWSCHGVDGNGSGPSARTLQDENGQPIRATNFRSDPYKGGREPQAIVRTLLSGLNGVPMPAYGEAMLFAADDFGSEPPLDGMAQVDVDGARALLDSLPMRTALEAMSDAEQRELRDARLAALSHYLLSLSRRDHFWNKVFHQQPEREGRDP